jgi:uncharacterized membrane protein YgdD (TMEM256/DUF423 family)
MIRALIAAGAVLGLVGVGVGAFGAHAVRGRLPEERMALLRTGVEYQLWHATATIVAAIVAARWSTDVAIAGGWCFTAGVILFSGSLYALALTGERRWGPFTPVGGLAFLAGWVLLAVAAIRG